MEESDTFCICLGSGQQQTTFKRNVSSQVWSFSKYPIFSLQLVQVYMLHTVKYNDPSAIAGAMAGSGSNKSGELNKKSPNDIKERKKVFDLSLDYLYHQPILLFRIFFKNMIFIIMQVLLMLMIYLKLLIKSK